MRKRVVLAAAIVLVAAVFSGCVVVGFDGPAFGTGRGSSVRGTGAVISHPVYTESFSAVQIGGHYEIVYRHAPVSSLRFELHENLVEYIDVEVRSGTLVISSEVMFAGNSTPRVYIYAPQLDSIAISGTGLLRDWDTLTTQSLSLDVGGAVEGSITLEAESVRAVVSGVASLRLEGRADTAAIVVAGAGEVSAGELQTRNASVNIAGVGSVTISVADALDVLISGAGSVRYIGDPDVTSNIIGAGSVTRIE